MKILVLVLISIFLTSCLSRKPGLSINGTSINGASIVTENRIDLVSKRIVLNKPSVPWVYELHEGGSVVAKAEGAIASDRVHEDKLIGTLYITYNEDLSKIVIREDISDATPEARFIYFREKPNGEFETLYLTPLGRRWDAEPLAVEIPYVIGFMPDGKVILHYKISDITEASSVEAFIHPTNVN